MNEFEPIRDWAKSKGLLRFGDIKTQIVKLGEEHGEVCRAVLRANGSLATDALGDMVICMVTLAHHMGVKLEDCINQAYNEIKSRQGTLFEGNFIKSEDGVDLLERKNSQPAHKLKTPAEMVTRKKKYKKHGPFKKK